MLVYQRVFGGLICFQRPVADIKMLGFHVGKVRQKPRNSWGPRMSIHICISMYIFIWLVVLTILKNMSSSMGRMTSHIYEMENKNLWNHQPVIYTYYVCFFHSFGTGLGAPKFHPKCCQGHWSSDRDWLVIEELSGNLGKMFEELREAQIHHEFPLVN